MSGIPIWVSVPGIIALVLVGVLISTMLLGASGVGDGHGGGDMEMTDHNGRRTGPASRSERDRDHHGGETAPAAPSDRGSDHR